MKYALIGTGKTGTAIHNAIAPHDIVAAFNSRHPVSLNVLEQADVAIVFVPGRAFGDLLPILMQTSVPVVIGTTGYAWPDHLDQALKAAGKRWMIGSNYSIGLTIMQVFAGRMQRALIRAHDGSVRTGIAETHHVHKIDAPSGTALFLAQALGVAPQTIAVTRAGDAKGAHTISFACPHDMISMTHEAHDRAAFAEGVLLACDKIAALSPGLHRFETLIEALFHDSLKG